MNQWEQIFFAIALAGFGWLLYSAHGRASSQSSQPVQAPIDSGDQVPFYLTFNQTAGYAGPLATPGLSQADYVPIPNAVIGQQNVSGCMSCSNLPFVYA